MSAPSACSSSSSCSFSLSFCFSSLVLMSIDSCPSSFVLLYLATAAKNFVCSSFLLPSFALNSDDQLPFPFSSTLFLSSALSYSSAVHRTLNARISLTRTPSHFWCFCWHRWSDQPALATNRHERTGHRSAR